MDYYGIKHKDYEDLGSLNADHYWHVLTWSHGLLPAMAVNVRHVDLAKHHCSIVQTSRQFWLDDELCDVVLTSSDGTAHRAHTMVLCAASKYFHNLLRGAFEEANHVRNGEPVEIAASQPVVRALLEYIYAGEPELPIDSSIELLRLADAYGLPDLKAAVDAGLRRTLDEVPVATALTILNLKHSQGLHDLKKTCEEKVSLHFEACVEEAAFLHLNEGHFGKILSREDLQVSREDVVLKGIFKWFKSTKDARDGALTLLLQHVDFQAISSENLVRIHQFATNLGLKCDHLQRDVHEALQAQKNQNEFRPKRRCLKQVSPYLGAGSQASGQRVLPHWYWSLRWHGDVFYCVCKSDRIYQWKPGEDDAQVIAEHATQVRGVNDLGQDLRVAVSPNGQIIVADCRNKRLVSGYGQVLAHDIEGLRHVFCSPGGVVYVLNQDGKAVHRLVGDELQLVIESEHLPGDEKFQAWYFFVTREEVVYLSDVTGRRVLRVKQDDPNAVAVNVVGDVMDSGPLGLFVTQDGKIYVANYDQGKVLALNPGEMIWTEVIKCPDQMGPNDVVVNDGWLYVSMVKGTHEAPVGCVYKYDLPVELDLELPVELDLESLE